MKESKTWVLGEEGGGFTDQNGGNDSAWQIGNKNDPHCTYPRAYSLSAAHARPKHILAQRRKFLPSALLPRPIANIRCAVRREPLLLGLLATKRTARARMMFRTLVIIQR